MKDIKGFEGLYAITEDGQVWSYKSNRFLKPYLEGKGYLKVSLSKNGEVKKCKIHRLVAEAFVPNPLGLPIVNHKDEVKTNNHYTNLEWTTNIDNIRYGTAIERGAQKKRKPVYCEELNREFPSMTAAANELEICVGNISLCCLGKKKTTGGYHWRFV